MIINRTMPPGYSVLDSGGHRWTFSQSVSDSDPAGWGGELVNP
jgi:hypothetical protein